MITYLDCCAALLFPLHSAPVAGWHKAPGFGNEPAACWCCSLVVVEVTMVKSVPLVEERGG